MRNQRCRSYAALPPPRSPSQLRRHVAARALSASITVPAISVRRHRSAITGRFTMATNDPNSAGCKRYDGRTSDSGCARSNHRSRRGSPVGLFGRSMSTANAEARPQYAARLRILHRPGRSPRRQRNPGDQDRCRAAQRADVPRPTGSERSENSRGDHICSRSGSRASIGRIRRRTGSGRAAS